MKHKSFQFNLRALFVVTALVAMASAGLLFSPCAIPLVALGAVCLYQTLNSPTRGDLVAGIIATILFLGLAAISTLLWL